MTEEKVYWCGVCGEPAIEAHMAYHAFVEVRDSGRKGWPDWKRWGLARTRRMERAYVDFLIATSPLRPPPLAPAPPPS